jgi:hypothetical protein
MAEGGETMRFCLEMADGGAVFIEIVAEGNQFAAHVMGLGEPLTSRASTKGQALFEMKRE